MPLTFWPRIAHLQPMLNRSCYLARRHNALRLWQLIFAVMLVGCWQQFSDAQDEKRYVARFANGELHQGNAVGGGHDRNAGMTLDGRQLLDDGNPMRYLVDRQHQAADPASAYVEMFSGDRLPGEVVGSGSEEKLTNYYVPQHLILEPTFEQGTLGRPHTEVRIVERYVRRIVWQQEGHDRPPRPYQPGKLFLRDGRQQQFRACRFSDKGMRLLTEKGLQDFAFRDAAEIHLQTDPFWELYFEELAALAPMGESLLMQWETEDGVLVTASRSRFEPNHRGNPSDYNRMGFGVHPIWSVDLFWIPQSTVAVRRHFRPHEVPLTRIPPESAEREGLLSGAGWMERINRSVDGSPQLKAGKEEHGWGIGVHATSRLTFALPPEAAQFQARVGLSLAVRDGGCVISRVKNKANVLNQSGHIIGNQAMHNVGNIDVRGLAASGETLTLEIDPAHAGRPAGADPVDIRDLALWLDPLLVLDQEKVKARIAGVLPSLMPGWIGWEVSATDGGTITWSNTLVGDIRQDCHFVLRAAITGGPLRLNRRVEVKSDTRWLLILAHRENGSGPKVTVSAGGEPITELEIPHSSGKDDYQPLLVPIADFAMADGQTEVDLELKVLPPDGDPPRMRWESAMLSSQLPFLFRALEDNQQGDQVVTLQANLDDENPPAEKPRWVTDDAYTGAKSLLLPAGGTYRLKLPKPLPLEKNAKWGEFRYVRFAFRKIGGGRVGLEIHGQGIFDELRYDAGAGDAVLEKSKRLWVQNLPAEWVVFTEEIASAEPRAAEMIDITVPDGEHVLLDHIYFARSQEDFKSIQAPSPDDVNEKARLELVQPLIEKILPTAVKITTADGRFATGTIIDGRGDILTAAHVCYQIGSEVTVTLSDGKEVPAIVQGVHRDTDVALVRIKEDAAKELELQVAQINGGVSFDQPDSLFIAATYLPDGNKVETNLIEVRRDFRNAIWTDLDQTNYGAGGGLFDREGRLVGVQSRRSLYGGFLYTRLNTVQGDLGRFQKGGEVWGDWYQGCGPMIGVSVESVNAGCKVTDVFKDSPAAQNDIRSGDIIKKVMGQSVVSLTDIFEKLGSKNPGDEIDVEIIRDKETMARKLKLVPRVP